MNDIKLFIKDLKKYRGKINSNTLGTLKGQALNGDLKGAEKGLKTALNKE